MAYLSLGGKIGAIMEQEIITLIQKAQAGDEDAFNEIYKRYYHSAFIKANSICQNEADAKDAVQDAFIQIHHSLETLQDIESFYSWMIMIVINKCKNQFRKNRIINQTLREPKEYHVYPEERIYMNPHSFAINEREKEILMEMIDELPKPLADIINLMYFEQLKLAEIADYLQIPLGTVKTRCQRAKKELKKKIEVYEATEGYHLSFKLDMLLPTSLIGTSLLMSLKTKSITLMNHCLQHATMIAGVGATSVVCITGYSILKESNWQSDEANAKNVVNQAPSIEENPFAKKYYDEVSIDNNKEAYFTCLNFADTNELMQSKSKEELQSIQPIFEEMKKNQTVYYATLKELGWENWYVQSANEEQN